MPNAPFLTGKIQRSFSPWDCYAGFYRHPDGDRNVSFLQMQLMEDPVHTGSKHISDARDEDDAGKKRIER